MSAFFFSGFMFERIPAMNAHRLSSLEKLPRNPYIHGHRRTSDMASIPAIVETGAHVEAVMNAFLSTGNVDVFTRHIEAMSDEDTRSSRAIMRGSENELTPMDEFLSMALQRKIITIDDVVNYANRYSSSLKTAAA
ncbi:MAG: hypothetical protein R3D70_22580 [Rhizobiaceae bacterium]